MLAVTKAVDLLLIAVTLTGCAATMRVVPGRTPPAQRLVDVQLASGSRCRITLSTGETFQGRIESVSADALRVTVTARDGTRETRVIGEAGLVRVLRFVDYPPAAKGWFGAGVGAALSIPIAYGLNLILGWSMRWPDLLAPGAIAGAITGATRPQKAELVFERSSSDREIDR